MLVKFNGSLTQSQYDALGTKDAGTLYFTTDTKRIYKGALQYSSGTGVAGLSYNSSTDKFTITYADGTTGTIDLSAEFSAKLNASLKGAANGVAELGADGKVPAAQLPSYVDDVLEYANAAAFPASGEAGKIYVVQDTNKVYRWSGSAYVVISETLALGETSSTAYRGDRGKTAYDHSQNTSNPHPLGNGTTAGFSTNDYTSTEKTKLSGLANTTIENVLTSDSTTNALSAAQGKALKTLADSKMTKQTAATAGEIVVFGTGGEAADSNKTFATSISAASTDAQVPTAKAVVDALSWA